MVLTAELLVVGYDLDAESEVHIGDRTLPEWHALGYKGTRRLVCYLCWTGVDAAPDTEVALVPRGRLGGKNRAHFAHPPGAGVHGSRAAKETIWHLGMKHRLAGWAIGLPNVASAVPERWTPDGKRRADVSVLLDDGSRLALEVQSRIITDRDWVTRHADYATNSIQDVWFMRSGAKTPYVLHERGVQSFTVHDDTVIAVQLGKAHPRAGNWWEGDLDTLALHYPPCAGEPIEYLRLPLDTLGLDRNGLVIAKAVATRVEADLAELRRDAETAKREAEYQAQRWARSHQQRATPIPPAPPEPTEPQRRIAELRTSTQARRPSIGLGGRAHNPSRTSPPPAKPPWVPVPAWQRWVISARSLDRRTGSSA
ncbi:hypothetical protein [Jatrophihabitans sp.]|jgi:hypothetical protein|uniref:competence protein CoiA family protein n=1 Tax=Jatrophihabitans sp. TaxID=1932789 RepID=UPI002F00465A